MAQCFTAIHRYGQFKGIVAYPPDWRRPNASMFEPEPLPFPHVLIGERTDLRRSLGHEWKIITFTLDTEPEIEMPTRVDNLTYFVKEDDSILRPHKKAKLRLDRSENEGRMALVHLIGFDLLTGRKYRRRKCYRAGRCESSLYSLYGDKITCPDCGQKYVHPEPHPDDGEAFDWFEPYYLGFSRDGVELLLETNGRDGYEYLVRLSAGAMMRCQRGPAYNIDGWLLAWNGKSLCFRQSQAWIDVTPS
jgi:hypothetical protein